MGGLGLNTMVATGTGGNAQAPSYGNQNLQNAATNFQTQYGSNPFVQAAQANTMGNIQGAQTATAANRVNQQTPYGSLQYTQTGTDQFGNPMWSANQTVAPEFQGALGNISNQLASQTNTPFNASQFAPQTSVAGGGMEGWDKASNLLMSRLNPQIEQGQERLQAQLANQGIAAGTEAYNRAMTLQGQKENDLRTQAQIAGSQVQNQMFGQNLQAGQFGNQAQNQAYQQAMGGYNLPLAQLGAFRQATAPTYINPYTQAAVAGPDILGAYTSSEAARIAQQNADAAKQAALTGGLFQLGGSALSNPSAVSGLGGLINKGIGAAGDFLGGLF
jgi:hypothetical protein